MKYICISFGRVILSYDPYKTTLYSFALNYERYSDKSIGIK